MLTEKIIKMPIFKYTLKIVVFDDFKEVKKKYPDISSGDDANGILADYGDRAMICVPPNDIAVIVHECEHAKNAVWQRIGFIPTPQNDEPDAYLIEYILEEVLKVVDKHLAH